MTSSMHQTRLFGIHNLSEDALKNAIEIGGLPCPSMALVRSDIGLEKYGEITLIAPAQMLNPRKVAVFDADIWSKRHPETGYKINERLVGDVLDEMQSKYPQDMKFSHETVCETLRSNGLKSLKDAASNSPFLLYAFARDMGRNPRLPKVTKQYETGLLGHRKIVNWLKKYPEHMINADSPEVTEELRAILMESISIEAEKIARAVNSDVEEEFREECVQEEIPIWHQRIASRVMEETDQGKKVSNHGLYKLYCDLRMHMKSDPIDNYKLRKSLFPFAEKHGRKFEEWLDAHFGDCVGEMFFYSEKRDRNGQCKKVPYSLESVVKEMRSQYRNTEGNMIFCGAGELRAAMTSQVKNVAQLEHCMSNMVSEDAMKTMKANANDTLADMAMALQLYYKYDSNRFGYLEEAAKGIQSYIVSGLRGFNEYFEDYDDEVIEQLDQYLAELKASPTTYLEAKFKRAVEINEFVGAVVPKNINKEVLKALKAQGLQIKGYEPDSAKDRLRQLNTFEQEMICKGPLVEGIPWAEPRKETQSQELAM
ncbi:hypothetical protein [Neptuniibacter sp. QD37_11]|uniref:hypothetical protein n=1 Tax=Neptuniibacter sp. QD37_11 TaxID=3398209 RepID=UPI0039F619E8